MGTTPKWHDLFVSGRLCLFGEHSDWAAQEGLHKGYCLVVGTDQGLSGRARRSSDFSCLTPLPDADGRPSGLRRSAACDWAKSKLLSATKRPEEFFRFCFGVAHEMHGRPGVQGAIELEIRSMDLPLKKGVSSSAAVCILVAKAFDAAYGLNMLPHELMEVAYRGETLAGNKCGRMDQACIYGKVPVLLTFEKDTPVRVEPVFPAKEISMFFVDLAGEKDTGRILGDLSSAYHGDPAVQRGLGAVNGAIVRQAYKALSEGNAKRLGELMTEAQRNFDELVAPACADQLSSPLMHEVLAFKKIKGHVHGGKGVGSQGDGTAQFVARSGAHRDQAMARIESAFPGMRCFPLTIVPFARRS